MLGCALDRHVARGLAPLLRDLDRPRPGQELAGERVGHLGDLGRGALGDDIAAVLARARTHVHKVISRAHRALVVLDHEHGVPEVAQALERGDQLLVIALVQTDRRLVEDVEHAHERRADLGRQADALGLPSGQRGRGALHRQVADPDVVEELEPLLDLAQDEPGDALVVVAQLEPVDPGERPPG